MKSLDVRGFLTELAVRYGVAAAIRTWPPATVAVGCTVLSAVHFAQSRFLKLFS